MGEGGGCGRGVCPAEAFENIDLSVRITQLRSLMTINGLQGVNGQMR